MTFINLGEGLEYHPISASFPPKMKQKLAFIVDDIPIERLIDSNFWFFLFRLQVWPSPTHNARALYEILIPALNAKPVLANINSSEPLMEWKSLPRASRETALFRCVKEALHFSLRSLGFSIGLTKYLSIVYRWAVCHMTIRDLDRMTSIRGSETHLIRIGCHQLAYNAAKQVKLYRIIQPLQLRQMKATIAQVLS